MGMTINVADSPLFREPIDRAFSQGMATIVEKLIRQRFDVHEIPDDLQERLSKLDAAALEDLSLKVADATSFESLFEEADRDAPPPPGSR